MLKSTELQTKIMVTNNVRSLSLILKFLYNEGQKVTNTLLLSICDLESQKNPKVNVARLEAHKAVEGISSTESFLNENQIKTKQQQQNKTIKQKNPSLVNLRNMS